MSTLRAVDTSNELLVHRHDKGIKLIRPDSDRSDATYTVKKLFDQQFNVYFVNLNNEIENCNEENAFIGGFESRKQAIGKSPYDLPFILRECADIAKKNNRDVTQYNAMKIVEEDQNRINNFRYQTLGIKMPWYDENNKIMGLFGCSIVLGRHLLADSLSFMAHLGFLNIQSNSPTSINQLPNLKNPLTDREKDILQLLLQGKTAKTIAVQLERSQRTIEKHIENMKVKTNTASKFDLIDFFMNA